MATGTSNTEMDDLKEMVRALTNRVGILSAANTDLNTKLVKAKDFTDAQAADLNARLMKSLEQNADLNKRLTETEDKLKAQSLPSTHSKEAERIPIKNLPKHNEFERWRMSVHASVVAASSDQERAVQFVAEVDDSSIDNAALLYTRPKEMSGLDAKLHSSILNMLPGNEDGERIHSKIKEEGSQFCGRQALRIIDSDYEWQGSRRAKRTIQSLVTLQLQNGLQGLDTFNRLWRETCYDLKGSPDDPSTRTKGSLLEDKLKALDDVAIGIGLATWKKESSATSNDVELKKAYEGLIASIESRCNDIRDGKPTKTAAPALENGNDEAEKDNNGKNSHTQRPKGKGRGGKSKREEATTGDEQFQGYCTFNKALCGNWGHQACDCFCNPESKNYKGDQYVKQLVTRKQEALQKSISTAAVVGDDGKGMSMDNMFQTWLHAKSSIGT